MENPRMSLIDEAGTLVCLGGIDNEPTTDQTDIPGAENDVRLAIADRAAGKPVPMAVSRPYGCSVKY